MGSINWDWSDIGGQLDGCDSISEYSSESSVNEYSSKAESQVSDISQWEESDSEWCDSE